ncbi:hypothetical protein HUA74_32800 [Myxococcus sp. CA051A]|uniref:hypothetical protein n=1 Tax=unclassified Myxococcus TaxID=2648731 RepID=UPI00157A72B1|nr:MULTISPECIES: hypothetical protein [unclassified Myxococcus]NTX49675.1 hypothetical protein [Myxococcus sp. CA039A]NTX65449.1 hypothetical protein [Myxococcus sp. CA051A]
MNDEEVLAVLRTEGEGLSAVELAKLLERLTGRLSHGMIVTYFKRAFPAIPLRVLLEAGVWWRVSAGSGSSDEQFNEMLGPWLGR